MNEKGLYRWQDCLEMEISAVHNLYRKYVNRGQVELIGTFGFGRVVPAHAEGMYITTTCGRKIYDFTGGVGVLNHGHNHPRILQARIEYQRQNRMEVHKNILSPLIAGISHNIAQLMPGDLDTTYFCNSGGESVEGAVKLAYKYHQGRRKCILHADIAFHGKLLGAAGLTGSPELSFDFPTIPNRHAFVYDDIESVKVLVERLRETDGNSDIYAIVVEPLNASSLRECSVEFLRELREICTAEDIILICDEVYSGWAKTGYLFNFMRADIVPDICTTAKSLGGGKSSIAGYVTRGPVFEQAYGNLNDCIMHSTTYNGFGEETATAMEAINILVEDDYVGRSQQIYDRLHPGLEALKAKYPDLIAEVRGSGALNGVLVNAEINKTLKAVLNLVPSAMFKDPQFVTKLVTAAVISELFNTHDILTFYGSNIEIPLVISPSLVASDEDVDYFLNALDSTLSQGKYTLLIKFIKQKFSSGRTGSKDRAA